MRDSVLHPECDRNVVRLPTQTLPLSLHYGIDQRGAKPVSVGPIRDRDPALAELGLHLRRRHQLLLQMLAIMLGKFQHFFTGHVQICSVLLRFVHAK